MKRIFKRAVIFSVILALSVPMLSVSAAKVSGAKLLAITFDDGPSQYTSALLDGLKSRNAKATFFMVGSNVEYHPEIVKRMKEEGHQLATHTMNHANLPLKSPEVIRSEVDGVEKRIAKIIGEGKFYLRPPYGAFNTKVKENVGTPMVHWSVDTEDWKYRNAQRVSQVIVNNSYDGAIILLHDLYKTSVDGALSAIDILQKEGYVFVTVEQLLRRRGITPEDGAVYFDAPNVGINLPAVVSPTIAARHTVVGTKVLIGKYTPTDKVYFTDDGKQPNAECPEYSLGYYVEEKRSVSAIALSDTEISDISESVIIPTGRLTKRELDRLFYRYRSPFLNADTKFVIGMNI